MYRTSTNRVNNRHRYAIIAMSHRTNETRKQKKSRCSSCGKPRKGHDGPVGAGCHLTWAHLHEEDDSDTDLPHSNMAPMPIHAGATTDLNGHTTMSATCHNNSPNSHSPHMSAGSVMEPQPCTTAMQELITLTCQINVPGRLLILPSQSHRYDAY